jgi:hypothetical protein
MDLMSGCQAAVFLHAALFAQRVIVDLLTSLRHHEEKNYWQARRGGRERPGLEEKEEGRAFGENSFVVVLVTTALLFLWQQGSSDWAILM